MNENYPIVRLEDPATRNVYYCRTTNWDSIAVGGGYRPETVDFTLNSAVRPGDYKLTVVGAGIASHPVRIRIRADELVGNYGGAQAAIGALAQAPAVSSPPTGASTKAMQMLKPIHRRN